MDERAVDERAMSERVLKFVWLTASLLALTACNPATVSMAPEPAERTAQIEQGPVKVEIQPVDGGFQLYRGGQPYTVRGVGLAADDPDAAELMAQLRAHGGNSFRTWHLGDGAFLDTAHALGLTVAVCLNVERERHGFDYDDEAAVAAQFARLEAEVLAHRDHPALLAWIIGNELNYDYTNPKVYDAVNDISRMIHRLDPNHPTTTATAGIDASLAKVIEARAPDLDFLSVQVYAGLFSLPQTLRDLGWTKPLMVTEWGTIGHWEVETTPWGAPLELSSTAKAATYLRGYQEMLAAMRPTLIGDYAFLWAQKQERTPTWYGMFSPRGGPTEVVDTLHFVWRDAWPANRAPYIRTLRLADAQAHEGVVLRAGQQVTAQVDAEDREGDRLFYEWELMRESTAQQGGGDREVVPETLHALIANDTGRETQVQVPSDPGAYRLFVYVRDDEGRVAHANIPFYSEARPVAQLQEK